MTRRSPAPDFPRSIFEFTQRFSSVDACWEYLRWARWPKSGEPAQSQSGSPLYTFIKTRKTWEFENGKQMSVTAGTVMDRSKVPLTMWFWAAYLVAVQTPGISAVQLGKHLGLRYETAFQLLHKLRAGLVNPDRAPLTGIVEVDETFIGGRKKGRRGRGAEGKSIVVGAVEVVPYQNKKGELTERAGRIRLQKIPDASGDELMNFLKENVSRSTVVRTDGWKGYHATSKKGYRHEVLTGETSVDVAEQLVHIHRVFSNLKTWLMGTHHGVSEKHLQAYLNEHVFRFNRRQSPFQSFASALGIATKVQGPEYDELYHAGEEGGRKHAHPKL